MKGKIDLVEEEHESEHEESESSGDESEDEEPRIKDVLSHLSRAVSEKRAYLVSCQFICRVFKLILVKLLIVCVFTIISQGAPLGLAVEMN